VPQLRALFSRLLRQPAPSAEQIAEEVSRVLRRNEESRIYHWKQTTHRYPPRRRVPPGRPPPRNRRRKRATK